MVVPVHSVCSLSISPVCSSAAVVPHALWPTSPSAGLSPTQCESGRIADGYSASPSAHLSGSRQDQRTSLAPLLVASPTAGEAADNVPSMVDPRSLPPAASDDATCVFCVCRWIVRRKLVHKKPGPLFCPRRSLLCKAVALFLTLPEASCHAMTGRGGPGRSAFTKAHAHLPLRPTIVSERQLVAPRVVLNEVVKVER